MNRIIGSLIAQVLCMAGEGIDAAGSIPLTETEKALLNGKQVVDTDKRVTVKTKSPILAALGMPTFIMGDGKLYPRQTGWGKDRKVHPDGGTNETIAFVVFKPFKGLELAQEGRIYRAVYNVTGTDGKPKEKREYSISLPFLKAERRDADGNRAIEDCKVAVRDMYRVWASDKTVAKAVKATVSKSSAWTEDDTTEAPATDSK